MTETPECIKWPHIGQLHNVRRTLEAQAEFHDKELPIVTYLAKVKLDGTNAALQVGPKGEIRAQSRTKLLTLTEDNHGFAHWLVAQDIFMQELKEVGQCVVFGEWCGPGIQKRTAISKIDRKVFAVYAIQISDEFGDEYVIDPEHIETILPKHPDVFVLPWVGDMFCLQFADTAKLNATAAKINGLVKEVEDCDPWVKENFGVEGIGEGVVLYPVAATDNRVGMDNTGVVNREPFSEVMFKAKGEKHQVVRQKNPAQVDPERAKSVEEFVDLVVTENRLQQGQATVCSDPAEMKDLGEFIKWVGQDVKRECAAELEESGLEWKDVAKAINTKARTWFIARL